MTALVESLEYRIRSAAQSAAVPGVSLAIVRNGKLERAVALGLRNTVDGTQVDDQTVFDAASLTKPLVAYAVLQLVDAGELNLDEPLTRFAPPIVTDDPASAWITARHVLAHTSGLPNVRGSEPLQFHFQSGSRFSYSGVGFNYLQRAVECITEEPFQASIERMVFKPLNMPSSSLEWEGRFRHNFASPHENGKRLAKGMPPTTASYSLQTTASDYGAFLMAVLNGTGLKAATFESWLTPHRNVPKGNAVDLGNPPSDVEPDIAWGLGWGLEPGQGTFFQWGKMEGVRSFTMGSTVERSAVVVLTNSNTGLRLMPMAAEVVSVGPHPALKWLQAAVSE